MAQKRRLKQFVYSDINNTLAKSIPRHFKAISDNGYIYDVAKDYKSLYDIVTK